MKSICCLSQLSGILFSLFWAVPASAGPGPIAWWRGEGNANDSAGTNHGSLINRTTFAPSIVPGDSGQSFSFDGNDDEVIIPNSADLIFTNGVTVAGWLRTSGSAEFSGLVDKFEQTSQATGFQVSMSGNNGFPPNQAGILRGDIGIGTTYTTAFNPQLINDGQPHHFALTCDGKEAILYVDGVGGAAIAVTNWVSQNQAPIVLGTDFGTSGRHFNGQLDEVMVYPRALGPAEVQGLAGGPRLTIHGNGANQATISWPATASGFHLQLNDTLNPGSWVDATTGTNNPVDVSLNSPARFYRLKKP